MDFSESWHMASTIWVPDARRLIFDRIQNGRMAVILCAIDSH